ncbi:MAG: FtsX-like permease family protein [Christensenellales bacterium]|jgi:hypothetical protein
MGSYFTLALYDIRRLVKTQIKSFLLLLLCFGIAMFAVCYFYTYFTATKKYFTDHENAYYTINLTCIETNHQGYAEMTAERDALLREFLAKDGMPKLLRIWYTGVPLYNMVEDKIMVEDEINVPGTAQFIIGIDVNDDLSFGPSAPRQIKGRWLDEEDRNTYRAVIHWTLALDNVEDLMVSAESYYIPFVDGDPKSGMVNVAKLPPMPQTIGVADEQTKYEVVGMAEFSIDYVRYMTAIIPIETFVKQAYPLLNITIMTQERLSNAQRSELVALMQDMMPNHTFSTASNFDDSIVRHENEFVGRMVRYSSLGILACVNAVSVFVFWMKRNLRPYALYLLCGCSEKRLRRTIVMEVALLTGLGFIVGLLLYYAVLWAIPMQEPYTYAMSLAEIAAVLFFIELATQIITAFGYRRTVRGEALMEQVR